MFSSAWYCARRAGSKWNRRIAVQVDDAHRRVRFERLLAGQHFVKNDAEAVDIATLID